jgi:multidrug efflux system outer membrane protein
MATMKTALRPAALGLAALIAGCASMAPRYEPPPLPVPDRYDGDTATAPGDAASRGWREQFTDPALQTLIESALAGNRDLRSATLRVAEARGAYDIQVADGGPTLAAQGTAARVHTAAALSLTGRAATVNEFQLAVGVSSWEIDFWGAVRSADEAALQGYLASDATRRAATLALIVQVVEGYLAMRETDERIALATQTLTTRQESVRIFTRRVEIGASSRLELTQVRTLLTQAQALLAQLKQSRATQGHALALLTGTADTLAPSPHGLDALAAMDTVAPGLPSELLRNRPDILAAEHQLRGSHANIGAARAAFFPRVALTGSFGLGSLELDQLFKGASRTWSFGPVVSLPLFDSGGRKAALDVAQTRRELALAAYDHAVQAAFRDVADALSARRWLNEQLVIAQDALAIQTDRARLSQLRFDSGASTYLDVLDAQRDLLTAQQQTVQVRRALLSSGVALYAALGGGASALPPSPAMVGASLNNTANAGPGNLTSP